MYCMYSTHTLSLSLPRDQQIRAGNSGPDLQQIFPETNSSLPRSVPLVTCLAKLADKLNMLSHGVKLSVP